MNRKAAARRQPVRKARNIQNHISVQTVDCPSCGVLAGSRCVTQMGAVTKVHLARIEAHKPSRSNEAVKRGNVTSIQQATEQAPDATPENIPHAGE